jgi:hypothetical protein
MSVKDLSHLHHLQACKELKVPAPRDRAQVCNDTPRGLDSTASPPSHSLTEVPLSGARECVCVTHSNTASSAAKACILASGEQPPSQYLPVAVEDREITRSEMLVEREWEHIGLCEFEC